MTSQNKIRENPLREQHIPVCIKTNDNLIYIDVSSNHPSQIKKQLTKIIGRSSENSSSEDIFNNTKLEYE